MKKYLIASLALAFGCATIARANTISLDGTFNGTGTDSFTGSTITFNPNGASGSPNNSIVAGTLTGSFANYFGDGSLITFLKGALPYTEGENTPPNSVFPLGYVPSFYTIAGSGAYSGDTFAFDLTSYDANYSSNGTATGCTLGDVCLEVTGTGFFTVAGTDAAVPGSGAATFEFTTQYAPGSSSPDITTFSASDAALPATPEPAPLILVGTGLLGLAGFARRRFRVEASRA